MNWRGPQRSSPALLMHMAGCRSCEGWPLSVLPVASAGQPPDRRQQSVQICWVWLPQAAEKQILVCSALCSAARGLPLP